MSITYSSIGSTYESKELTLLKEDTSMDWKSYPVLLTENEKKSMNLSRVVTILTGAQSPSEIAGIKKEERTIVIEQIDFIFRDKLAQYQLNLESAAGLDKKLIPDLDKRVKELDQQTSNYAFCCTLFGLLFVGVGAIPMYHLGASLDQAANDRKEREKRDIQREESSNRRAWLYKVDVLEEERYKEIKNLILCRCIFLIKDLKELEKDGEYSKEKLYELKQLERVYRIIFPDALPMVVIETDVSEYIKKFQTDQN